MELLPALKFRRESSPKFGEEINQQDEYQQEKGLPRARGTFRKQFTLGPLRSERMEA